MSDMLPVLVNAVVVAIACFAGSYIGVRVANAKTTKNYENLKNDVIKKIEILSELEARNYKYKR